VDIRQDMKLLVRHEGEWKGTYTHVDLDGTVVDRHESHLTCRFPNSDDGIAYHQTNTYMWPDGRTEVHEFPATYANGNIWFDTARIRGHAWEIDDNTIVLTWVYKERPEMYLYEMIQLSRDGNHRARTWHWFQDDRLYRRTLIDEQRVDAS
jgi:hypothetical protein